MTTRWRVVILIGATGIALGCLYYYQTRVCCAPPPITFPDAS